MLQSNVLVLIPTRLPVPEPLFTFDAKNDGYACMAPRVGSKHGVGQQKQGMLLFTKILVPGLPPSRPAIPLPGPIAGFPRALPAPMGSHTGPSMRLAIPNKR